MTIRNTNRAIGMTNAMVPRTHTQISRRDNPIGDACKLINALGTTPADYSGFALARQSNTF